MRGILNIRMLSVRAALLATLAAGLVLPGAQAQSAKQNQKSEKQASGSSQAQPPSAGRKAGEEESAPANKEHAGGPQEGIKVHGHWVIDVRKPDGKLVTHREFENSYAGSGALAAILARKSAVGFWAVYLLSDTHAYILVEPSSGSDGESKNLALSTSGAGFVLTGSFTPGAYDIIQDVLTAPGFCVPPTVPCQAVNYATFTSTVLPTYISFVAGQIVQVTVTITFS